MRLCQRSFANWLINLRKMPIYRREITGLFGDNLIGVIKELIKKGSLTRVNIKDIADCMEVREEFDKHNDRIRPDLYLRVPSCFLVHKL